MAVSMHVVFSLAEPRRVIYETHSIDTITDDDGVHPTVNSKTHEVVIHSRAQAESIAAEEGYELLRKGDVWDSLPET